MRLQLQIAVLTATLSVAFAEELELSRVHLIEYNATSGNYLFRGNMPVQNKKFACACEMVSHARGPLCFTTII